MPIALRQAEAVWAGTLAGGAGALSSGSGALVLGENHTAPERLTVTAACTLDEVEHAARQCRDHRA